MKKNLLGLLFTLTITAGISCGKSIPDIQASSDLPLRAFQQRDTANTGSGTKPDTVAAPPAPTVPLPQVPLNGCSFAPTYGDTIIFPQPTNGQDYVVLPVNNPGPGKYLSWPGGMVIDSLTGAIDVTKSQTGQRYA